MKYFTVMLLLCYAALANGTSGDCSSNDGLSSSEGSSIDPETNIDILFQGKQHVKFHLHNHHDLNNPHELKFNSTINSKLVNIKWKTIMFIHGWKAENRWAEEMKNAFLEVSDRKVNLIEIDWLDGAYSSLYCRSVERVPDVGETVARFIGLNQKKFNLKELTIVGHGLGAHAAGFAGKWLISNYKFKPRLIVGLDPAGPYFRGNTEKLQPTDAQDVIVIHTCQLLGHLEPLGTCDFYINVGKSQPGCTDAQSHGFSKLIYKELVLGKVPFIGHRYSSFAEVKKNIVPQTEGIPLLNGAPWPSRRTLMYVGTQKQPHLIAEVKKYINTTSDSDFSMYRGVM